MAGAIRPPITAMVLADFVNRHRGETAWLFGKGPSLNQFDISTAGPLRVSVNETFRAVPGCIYAFANDPADYFEEGIFEGLTLFQPRRVVSMFDPIKHCKCEVVAYDDSPTFRMPGVTREELAQCMTTGCGTLPSAIQALWIMGVSQIIMVGIDGSEGRADTDGYEWAGKMHKNQGRAYANIKESAIIIAEMLGVKLLFAKGTEPMTDGKVYIRVIGSVCIDGKGCRDGEIISVTERKVQEILTKRCGEVVKAPPREEFAPVVETATMPMAAVESAVVKTVKRRK